MNTEPKKTPPVLDKELTDVLKSTPQRIWKKLYHNWGWKLLSLLLAVCLWAGLISQDPNLTRERRFTDVPIALTNQETLRRNGMIVLSGLEQDTLKLEAFRTQVPQRSYDTVTAANYNPRIDLSRITETGEQEAKVVFTTSSSYGTVEAASPDTFHIVVDEYVTNYRVPVMLNVSGEYPAGFYAANPIVEPSMIAVSGPKTLVDQVVGVRANIDLNSLSSRAGVTRLALPLYFVDANGDMIESNLLEASSANTILRTITVEQRLYTSKTLDISHNALLTGTPAKGYEVKSVSSIPSAVTAAGEAAALDTIDSLFFDNAISVEGASESFTTEIRLRKPSELNYLSTNSATVFVEIEPIISSRDFTDVKVKLRNAPSGLKSTIGQKTVTVTVEGPMLDVQALYNSDILVVIDAYGLTAGEYTLPVEVYLKNQDMDNFQFTVAPASIPLTLK